MRKIFTSIGIILGLGIVGIIFYNKFSPEQKLRPQYIITEIDGDDGKREAQLLEIQKTKDIHLGYVPKSELISSYNKLQMLKKAQANIKAPYSFPNLNWLERGPNADGVGPYNGNIRPNNGITSGRIRAVWVDMADVQNKTVWVGGIDGGLWKTNDINASPAQWTLVNDFFTNMGVSSICQNPLNTNIMYFGTGEKTPNMDASKGGGVWKSTDHGITWNLLPATVNFWNTSKIICDMSGNLFIATIGSNSGIQRSSDGGNSWTNITPSGLNLAVTDMKLSSTGRMHIVCGYENGMFNFNPAGYRFTDQPATVTASGWNLPITIFPYAQYNVELAVSGNTIYALPANSSNQTPQIYKSIDGGLNWASTITSPPVNSSVSSISNGQSWYDLAIAADPANPNNVIAGGLNCYRSADGGNTWTNVSAWVGNSNSYIHADQQYAVWNGNQVLVASDGGIFYSNDNGNTFFDRNEGLRIKQFYSCAIHPSNINYFLAGAQDNGVHQFNSPGLGNSIEVTGGDGGFVHIDQDEPQFQFGSYVYNNYRRSRDGGISWEPINYSNSGSFINPFDYDDVNNKIYAATGPGQFLRWEDPQTGNNFNNISLSSLVNSKVSCVKVSSFSPNTVFFGTNNGTIVKVSNANNAKPVETNISGFGMGGLYISNIETGTSEDNLICSVSNYGAPHIWVSNSGGSSWVNISGNLPNIPVRWARFFPEDNTKAIIATELGVYETSLINGSATVWVNDPNFPIVRTDM